MKPNVHLTIDRLVLHGFGRINRTRLHAAVTAELARLIADGGAPEPLEAQRLDLGAIRVASNAPAEKLGVQIAQTIYGGMKP